MKRIDSFTLKLHRHNHCLRILALCFFFFSEAHAQDLAPFLEKWPVDELKKVEAASNVPGLDPEEQSVLFFTNLVRINPSLFEKTVLPYYVEAMNSKRSDTLLHTESNMMIIMKNDVIKPDNPYLKSLHKTLHGASPRELLVFSQALRDAAAEHAQSMGIRGRTGHERFSARIRKHLGKNHGVAGENCAYGSETGMENVMELLIDEDVPDLGHRKNILDKDFRHIGVAIRPHKKYGTNCVMEFSGPAQK